MTLTLPFFCVEETSDQSGSSKVAIISAAKKTQFVPSKDAIGQANEKK
jgi:hypothetical protein